MKRWLAIFAVLICAASANAQVAVYGMGSAGRLSGLNASGSSNSTANSAGSFWAYGGTVGIYDDFFKLGPVKLGGDVRGFIERSSSSNNTDDNQLRGGLVGLRLALHAPLVPAKPYIQAEIGGASTQYTDGQNSSNTGTFAYQVQFGADFAIFPHMDFRAEYGVGQLIRVLGSNSNRMQQFGAGLALRF